MEAKTAQTGKINGFQNEFKLVFGQWANAGNAYRRFDGDIDEVTLWNIALTQTQIRTYMCKKLVGNESGLIGYWRMNETGGNLLYDVTSNARTGSASNTTIVWSGAPIGDASTFTYGGSSLSISQPANKDSLVVGNFSGTPSGVQLYRIDTVPNSIIPPAGYVTIFKNYYYGVFVCDNKGANFKMTYYYAGNPAVSNPSQTGIAYRSDNSELLWTDVGASLNVSKKLFQKGGQKNRAEYAVVVNYTILPITLTSFTATPSGNSVILNWITGTEKDNDHFTIERTSDGINYETIATIKGAGNSDMELSYSAVDGNPASGTSYYRLKQTDYDGNSQTYGPIAVDFAPKTSNNFDVENVYPNPFTDHFNISLVCDNSVNITMQLVATNGAIVKQDLINCAKGDNIYQVTNVSGLKAGMYILFLYDATTGHKISEKVLKQ